MPELNDKTFNITLLYINTRSENYTVTYTGQCEEEFVHKFHLEPAS